METKSKWWGGGKEVISYSADISTLFTNIRKDTFEKEHETNIWNHMQ